VREGRPYFRQNEVLRLVQKQEHTQASEFNKKIIVSLINVELID